MHFFPMYCTSMRPLEIRKMYSVVSLASGDDTMMGESGLNIFDEHLTGGFRRRSFIFPELGGVSV